MLHQQRIARHQIRSRDTRQLIVGEVPRLDAEEHAQRFILDKGLTLIYLQFLRCQEPLRIVGIVVQNIGAQFDFSLGLPE
jgi:hypothetical protein